MVKRSDIRILLLTLASICLVIFLFGDVLRGKSWEMGPLQLLGSGVGIGLLGACLVDLRMKTEAGKKQRLTGAGLLLVGLCGYLLVQVGNSETINFILPIAVFLGCGAGLMMAGILLLKQFTRSLFFEILLVLSIILPLTIWIIQHYIHLDFWYDEVYSLKWFILVPVINSLTDYNAPNNHIFFSLLSNLYLKTIGIQDINRLVEAPEVLRYLTLFFSLIGLLYLYLAARNAFNRFVAVISLLIIATTLPFYNFAVQIRGYSLTMMLVSLLLYSLWGYDAHPSKWKTFQIILGCALLLYTIPTNLYFLLSIALFYFIRALQEIIPLRNEKRINTLADLSKVFLNNRSFRMVLLIASGSLLAVAGYLPVLSQLRTNALVKDPILFPFKVFYPTMITTFRYLISERMLLLFLAVAAFLYWAQAQRKHGNDSSTSIEKHEAVYSPVNSDISSTQTIETWFLMPSKNALPFDPKHWFSFFGIALIFPFVVSFFHGYDPYYRVFLFVLPVLGIFLAYCLHYLYIITPKYRHKIVFVMLALFLYCILSFSLSVRHRNQTILNDIFQSNTSQDIFNNYYQAYYNPLRVFKDFTENHMDKDIPVFIYQWGDTQAIPLYATKFVVRHNKIESVQEIFTSPQGNAHVITTHPYEFIDELQQVYPNSQCSFLYQQPNYLETLECACTSADSPDEDTGCPPVRVIDNTAEE